jgi:hypothetical protein
MKYYHRFRVREAGFSPDLYQQICARKPECRSNEDFIIESQPGDEINSVVIQELVNFCEQNAVPPAKMYGEFKAYDYDIVRHYEADDLKVAPLLILETQKRMFRDRLKRDESGRLLLPAAQSGVSIKLASGMFNHVFVVSEATKNNLEAGGFTDLLFRETVQKGTSIRATTEPLWELETTVKLPKMVNSFLNPHSPVPCHGIDERPYRYGEPHYRQCDLSPLGEFNVARTFETLGSDSGLIVSQRFYQHCLKNKIQLEVRPVRVDLD